MRFVSIDVGIKNLSFCFFETSECDHQHIKVLKWDNINLMETKQHVCLEVDKKGVCNKPAKFSKNNKCYCLKHSKKTNFLQPILELKSSHLNKQKISSLLEIASKYKLLPDNNNKETPKKSELIKTISDFASNQCLDVVSKTNASKCDLITIGKNIQTKFDTIFEDDISSIDSIIIENQIGPIANKMKTIQGMLAQYFIMRTNGNIHIEFISATNKLKHILEENKNNHEKTSYKDRKKLGVQTCLNFVTNDHRFKEWEDFFKQHGKKDDLSDCFLQGMWFSTFKKGGAKP
jgi:hypothetical protein